MRLLLQLIVASYSACEVHVTVNEPRSGKPVRALLLVNPKSRQGASEELQQVVQTLRRNRMDVEYLSSGSESQSHQAVRERSDRLDLVIVAGGDGTLGSMLEVLLEHRLALGILPLGTANDLARSLGISPTLSEAVDVLLRNQRRHIDVAEVNGRFFFNVANMGLGVKVTDELDGQAKDRWGVFSYLKALRRAIARRDRFTVTVNVDGEVIKQSSMQVAVGNGRFYGGGNVVDERASITSGLLYVYSLRPQGVWEFLTLAPLLRTGRQRGDLRVYSAAGREVSIETIPGDLEIHADGEPISRTPASFSVRPGALEVVTSFERDNGSL